jgi:hypothetical protein
MERDGHRPPRIQIGDPELGRRLPAQADPTLVESRVGVDVEDLEQRCKAESTITSSLDMDS